MPSDHGCRGQARRRAQWSDAAKGEERPHPGAGLDFLLHGHRRKRKIRPSRIGGDEVHAARCRGPGRSHHLRGQLQRHTFFGDRMRLASPQQKLPASDRCLFGRVSRCKMQITFSPSRNCNRKAPDAKRKASQRAFAMGVLLLARVFRNPVGCSAFDNPEIPEGPVTLAMAPCSLTNPR